MILQLLYLMVVVQSALTLSVRLVNGGHSHRGRVEVQFNSIWGTVCHDGWDNDNARVVCRQLGFPHEKAVATIRAAFGEGTGQILLDDVQCNGEENNLGECSHRIIGVHSCTHGDDAGVICTNVSPPVRLVNGGHSHQGRVEVQLNGVWSTVCDITWDNNDARVVCHQLGFPHENAIATLYDAFGEGTGQILLHDVNCNGAENNLGECSYRGVGIHYCGHHRDAGVICTNVSPQVRLVNGGHSHQGRVEVQFNGVWITVCGNAWGNNDARVVCRQLGFPHENAVATLNAAFGEGTGQILLDGVNCNGAENNFGQCSYHGVGDNYCRHRADSGIICTNVSPQVRLVHGGHSHRGQVEVQFNGAWITVCGNAWDNNDARVVCRQLGFAHENAVATRFAAFGEGTGQISLDGVNCNGAENNLVECSYHGVGVGLYCGHRNDAGVICANDTTIRGVRLVNGGHPHQGRVEVQVDGVWGTVCDNLWDNNDARVVCRQLGFDPVDATATSNAAFGEGTGAIFLDRVDCNGAENNLGECSHRGVGVYFNCLHRDDAGVICTNDGAITTPHADTEMTTFKTTAVNNSNVITTSATSGMDKGTLTTTQLPFTEMTSDKPTGVNEESLTTTQLPVTEMSSDKATHATGTVLTASGTYNMKLKNIIKLTFCKD